MPIVNFNYNGLNEIVYHIVPVRTILYFSTILLNLTHALAVGNFTNKIKILVISHNIAEEISSQLDVSSRVCTALSLAGEEALVADVFQSL